MTYADAFNLSVKIQPDDFARRLRDLVDLTASWGILHLRQLVRDGETPGGDPVERVSVLFPDRASAEREKRPLLDVGVVVEYYDEGGERTEMER